MQLRLQAWLASEFTIPENWSYYQDGGVEFGGKTLSLRNLLQCFSRVEQVRLQEYDDLIKTNAAESGKMLSRLMVENGWNETISLLGNAATETDLSIASEEKGLNFEQAQAVADSIIMEKVGEFIQIQRSIKLSAKLIESVDILLSIADGARSITDIIRAQNALRHVMLFLDDHHAEAKLSLQISERSVTAAKELGGEDENDFFSFAEEFSQRELAHDTNAVALWQSLVQSVDDFAHENKLHSAQFRA